MSGQSQQINTLLEGARNILIVSHENPDADAIGSTLALHLIFKKLGLINSCFLPDPPLKHLNFLPGFFEIKTGALKERGLNFLDFDLFFCLDYGDFRRLHLPDNLPPRNIITIDHHSGDQRGGIKIIKPNRSSTSEIIYELLSELKIEIDKETATCLLTGIIFDTGLFSHISTSSQTIRIAADLLSKGAPLSKIIRSTFNPGLDFPSFPQYAKIWGQALWRAKFDRETRLVYSWITREELEKYRISPEGLTKISSLIATIFPAELALFLVEYEKGEVKGSLRSEPFRGRNVALLAKTLGGGGHPYAAGFKQKGTVENTLKKVIKLIG